jgi:hypothetical protein
MEKLSLTDVTARITVISVAGMLIGSVVLFGIAGGPLGLLAGPVLALFGWFFIFPLAFGVTLLWAAYHPKPGRTVDAWLLVVSGSVGGAVVMSAFGALWPETIWRIGFAMAGLVTGGCCARTVVALKTQ